jgi:hypothetical protein
MINGRAISHTDPLRTEAWSVPIPHGTPTCRSLSPGPLQTRCGRPLDGELNSLVVIDRRPRLKSVFDSETMLFVRQSIRQVPASFVNLLGVASS